MKCTTMVPGVQCVTMDSMTQQPQSSADLSDSGMLILRSFVPGKRVDDLYIS